MLADFTALHEVEEDCQGEHDGSDGDGEVGDELLLVDEIVVLL